MLLPGETPSAFSKKSANGSALRSFDHILPDLNGKALLVTGGTGSFGKAFIRATLDRYRPTKLIVFSRDEQKQYEMEQEFQLAQHDCLRYFIGDVRDSDRLEMAMRNVDYVIHAAAMKHVSIAEYNPFECVNTNIIGAQNVVKAAINAGVRKVLNLSTDKATNPLNLYGATKLAAEKIMTAANTLAGKSGTRFASVRYGNVMGSRGSVVPLFRRLMNEGAEALPITDERMTRFWITLDQGVNFVLSSMTMMQGGEVFIPKIPSMRVVDLAKIMAPDMPIKVIGIRPGEKLHEVLITADDARNTVELDDRYVIWPQFRTWAAHGIESAQSVPESFSYASDNNHEWLDDQLVKQMLDLG